MTNLYSIKMLTTPCLSIKLGCWKLGLRATKARACFSSTLAYASRRWHSGHEGGRKQTCSCRSKRDFIERGVCYALRMHHKRLTCIPVPQLRQNDLRFIVETVTLSIAMDHYHGRSMPAAPFHIPVPFPCSRRHFFFRKSSGSPLELY